VYWEVETVKKRKIVKGKELFLIKWKGSTQETWEPEENLCDSALEEAREISTGEEGSEVHAKKNANGCSVVCIDKNRRSKVRFCCYHDTIRRPTIWEVDFVFYEIVGLH
jgi:hypothetical protein